MVEHSLKGASGLILNRPSDVQISDIWKNVSDSPLGRDETIFVGGPVEGPLSILHAQSDYSEQRLMDGLYLSMKGEKLDVLLANKNANLRVFSGYAGWGPGQLENELTAGGWLKWNAEAYHVFLDPEQVYKVACDELGLNLLFGEDVPFHLPKDPRLN